MNGQFDKAIADLNQAIQLSPGDPQTYVIRGRAWHGKRKFHKAIADYDEAARLDVRSPRRTSGAA